MSKLRRNTGSPGKAFSDGFAKGKAESAETIRELQQDKAHLRDQLASLSKLHAKEAEAWERSREAEVRKLQDALNKALAENLAMRPKHFVLEWVLDENGQRKLKE